MRRRSRVAALVGGALLLSACVRGAPVLEVEVVSDDGRELLVDVGACRSGLQIETRQTDERVRIAVRARGGDGDCTQQFRLTLDEPLGDRPVVDAVTDQEVEVRR